MSFRLTVAAVRGNFREEFGEIYSAIQNASQATIVQTAIRVKTEARANIGAARFSYRWQNALRVNVYPKAGASVNAAALIYHKIGYAGIFEEGGTISGKPLWLRLPSTPKKIGNKPLTAKRFIDEIGPLQKSKNRTPPLLFGKVAANGPGDTSVTLNKIRQAYGRNVYRSPSSSRPDDPNSKRLLAGGRAARVGFTVKTVPMFVGKDSVTIPDKFSIREICEAASARLGDLYFANLKDD